MLIFRTSKCCLSSKASLYSRFPQYILRIAIASIATRRPVFISERIISSLDFFLAAILPYYPLSMSLGRKSIKAQRSKSSIRQTDVETAQLLAQQNASNIVNWDHDLDPANPLNWSPRKKWANILTISLASFSMYLSHPVPVLSKLTNP